jgi:hypothetical protein
MNRRLISLVLALLVASPSFAQQKVDPPTPASGNVTLSLDEYNRLLALANRPNKKTEAPPQPYLLKRADLKFRVNNDDVVGSIQFEGETLSANTTVVPLTSGMTGGVHTISQQQRQMFWTRITAPNHSSG